jgi:sugar (pentulose or hexulose) kinase
MRSTPVFLLKDNLAELERCGLVAENITMIGGISNSAVCVDIVSEMLGRPISVANGQAAGAIGAALLAGIGVGMYQTEKDAFSVLDTNRK